MRLIIAAVLATALAAACGGKEPPPPSSTSALPPAAEVAGRTAAGCPSNGIWAACSLVYRLERAGLAPKVDSTAKPSERLLTGKPILLKIGLSATLELYVYPDSSARAGDAVRLDRRELVSGTEPQTIKRERTLVESANIIALLTSINAHQRERVSDALLAGPPQPQPQPRPHVIPPSAAQRE